MLIGVSTGAGIRRFGPGPAHDKATRKIDQTIGPFLEGRDPTKRWGVGFRAPLETPIASHFVEVAVTDSTAWAEGATASKSVGSRVRVRIKGEGPAGTHLPPKGYAVEAEALRRLSFLPTSYGPLKELEAICGLKRWCTENWTDPGLVPKSGNLIAVRLNRETAWHAFSATPIGRLGGRSSPGCRTLRVAGSVRIQRSLDPNSLCGSEQPVVERR